MHKWGLKPKPKPKVCNSINHRNPIWIISCIVLNGKPFEYIKRPIFLYTSFLSSYFHLEFKVLCLGFEMVNLSMGPLRISCPLTLLFPVPFVLQNAFSFIGFGPMPIFSSNSFLFYFCSLKLFNASLCSNLTSSLTLVHGFIL